MLIYLDAGHGMKTAGKRCLKSIDPNETRENFLNRRVADYVQTIVGEAVTIKRSDDITGNRDVPLSERVNKANSDNADFFISIHHNAGVNGGSGGGTQVYFYGNDLMRPTHAQLLYERTIEQTGLVGNRADKIVKQNLYVLRKTVMPALLIECGFMDSTTDTPIILTDNFALQVAKGISNFILYDINVCPTCKRPL